jgi:hypothetical protein
LANREEWLWARTSTGAGVSLRKGAKVLDSLSFSLAAMITVISVLPFYSYVVSGTLKKLPKSIRFELRNWEGQIGKANCYSHCLCSRIDPVDNILHEHRSGIGNPSSLNSTCWPIWLFKFDSHQKQAEKGLLEVLQTWMVEERLFTHVFVFDRLPKGGSKARLCSFGTRSTCRRFPGR